MAQGWRSFVADVCKIISCAASLPILHALHCARVLGISGWWALILPEEDCGIVSLGQMSAESSVLCLWVHIYISNVSVILLSAASGSRGCPSASGQFPGSAFLDSAAELLPVKAIQILAVVPLNLLTDYLSICPQWEITVSPPLGFLKARCPVQVMSPHTFCSQWGERHTFGGGTGPPLLGTSRGDQLLSGHVDFWHCL